MRPWKILDETLPAKAAMLVLSRPAPVLEKIESKIRPSLGVASFVFFGTLI